MTSRKQAWGPRERDVNPKPVMETTVERSKLSKERKRPPIVCSLVEHHGPEVRSYDEDDFEETKLALPGDARMLIPLHLPPDVKTSLGFAAKGPCFLTSWQL